MKWHIKHCFSYTVQWENSFRSHLLLSYYNYLCYCVLTFKSWRKTMFMMLQDDGCLIQQKKPCYIQLKDRTVVIQARQTAAEKRILQLTLTTANMLNVQAHSFPLSFFIVQNQGYHLILPLKEAYSGLVFPALEVFPNLHSVWPCSKSWLSTFHQHQQLLLVSVFLLFS